MTPVARLRQAQQAAHIALLTTPLYLVTMLSQVVNAWNSKRVGERRWHMTVPLVLGGVSLMCASAAVFARCAPQLTNNTSCTLHQQTLACQWIIALTFPLSLLAAAQRRHADVRSHHARPAICGCIIAGYAGCVSPKEQNDSPAFLTALVAGNLMHSGSVSAQGHPGLLRPPWLCSRLPRAYRGWRRPRGIQW